MLEDPRQARTRVALTEAFHALVEDENLSTISVAALCSAAGVHRTTFYGHAASIEEFAVDVMTRELDEVSTVNTGDGDSDPLAVYGRTMVDVLESVAKERRHYRALLASKWGGALRVAIDERMQVRVRIALDVFAKEAGTTVPGDREQAVAFISGALVGVIVAWALSDDEDAQAWAKRTQSLMPLWWPVR